MVLHVAQYKFTVSLDSYIIILYLSLILSLYYIRDKRSNFFFIQILLFITVIVESIGYFYLKLYNKAAVIPYLLFQPLEYICIVLYFNKIIFSKRVKKIIRSTIPFTSIIYFAIYFISYQYNLSKYSGFLFISVTVSAICLLYFYQLLNREIDKKLQSNPHFFIATGILLFHTCSFMVMGLVNYIYTRNQELARRVFSINHILNIIYYSLITYAFYIQWKSTKSSSSS